MSRMNPERILCPIVSLKTAKVTIAEVNVKPTAVQKPVVAKDFKRFDVSWVPTSGFNDRYELEQWYADTPLVLGVNEAWTEVSKTATATSASIEGVVNGYYHYRVRACRDGGLVCGDVSTCADRL